MNNTKIIGVLHLQEFPKTKDASIMEKIKQKALTDISALQFGGVDSVIIENEFDGSKSPYGEFLTEQQQEVMFEVVAFLKPYIFVELGFCVLLNDYKTALLLAKKFGGSFIRLDTFVDNVERISDGIKIFPNAEETIKFRKDIEAENVKIWTDIHVKHTKLLDKKTIEQSAKQAILAGADKLIVTGSWTGKTPKISDILKVKEISKKISVVIGSGIDEKNISKYKNLVDEFIIGSALKKGSKVDIYNVHKIVSAKNELDSKHKRVLLISSFSWDHIENEKEKIIKPGGPAFYISKVFNDKKLSYELATSNITNVKEKISNDESIGSEMDAPKKILLDDKKYDYVVISTQLQEFNLNQLLNIKAKVFIDLQGYVSDEKFGVMKKFSISKDIWKKLDFVKCNEKELAYLPQDFVDYFKREKVFILTKGRNGVEYYIRAKKLVIRGKQMENIKNTLGAGDTFLANFVYYFITLKDIKKAVLKANSEAKKFLLRK